MATQDQKKEVSEVKAYARGIRISPRKARLVVDLIRKMTVEDALRQLEFTNKRAAGLIKKIINSAVANASHNFQVTQDRLFIKSFTVDGGPFQLRYQPRAQGRALPIRKQTSHFNLMLGVTKGTAKVKKSSPPIYGQKQPEPINPPKADKSAAPEKTSRFGFFKRKSKQDTPPSLKEDVKGKGRVNIDRRSGS